MPSLPTPIPGSPLRKKTGLRFSLGLLVGVVIVFFADSAVADDPQADPLGLIAGYDVTTHYSLGDDLWEVWVCESPDGDLDISVSEIVKVLTDLVPYFAGCRVAYIVRCSRRAIRVQSQLPALGNVLTR